MKRVGQMERTSVGTYLWHEEPRVQGRMGGVGLMNWMHGDTPITEYAGGVAEAYEDPNCCSSSIMGSMIDAVKFMGEVARKDGEQNGTLPHYLPEWFPMEYLPVSVEFLWGDTWDNYGESDKGAYDLIPSNLRPKEEYPFDFWAILPELPSFNDPRYPLARQFLEPYTTLLQPHFGFVEHLYHLEGNSGATIVKIEVAPDVCSLKTTRMREEDQFSIFGKRPLKGEWRQNWSSHPEASRHGHISKVICPLAVTRILFLDETESYVDKKETVFLTPLYKGWGDRRGYTVTLIKEIIKAFAPNQEEADKVDSIIFD